MPLEEQAKKLERIIFHEKLGTVADKVERVAKLARWLVEEGIVGAERSEVLAVEATLRPRTHPDPSLKGGENGELADQAEQAARLAKADLVTGMVGEFPELQGLMGGYYARAEGEAAAVADAIRDHYKPVGQGDDVPTAPVTVAVSLADKLDTLVGFFAWMSAHWIEGSVCAAPGCSWRHSSLSTTRFANFERPSVQHRSLVFRYAELDCSDLIENASKR